MTYPYRVWTIRQSMDPNGPPSPVPWNTIEVVGGPFIDNRPGDHNAERAAELMHQLEERENKPDRQWRNGHPVYYTTWDDDDFKRAFAFGLRVIGWYP